MLTNRIALVLATISLSFGSAAAETLLFDFGRTDLQTNPGWNNIVPATGNSVSLRFDSNNNLTPIGFEITDPFFQTGEPSQLGSEAPFGDAAAFPVSATDDYFFGHTTPFAGADPNPLGQVKLFNLGPQCKPMISPFSRHAMESTTPRDASYTVHGASSSSVVLNASNNNSEVARIFSIAPDTNSEIVIDVTPGPGNDNGNGFYYINLMQVDVVPEPSSLSLLLAAIVLTAVRRRKW